jgi:flagellar basal body-associated protein FliL
MPESVGISQYPLLKMNRAKQRKPKKWRKWLILLLVAIIALAGGYLYFTIWHDTGKASDFSKKKKTTLASFTVNLVDSNYRRYLRTEITLEYWSDEVHKEVQMSMHRIKDVVLKVLRSKTVIDIDSPNETELLKLELMQAINSVITSGEINGLYFEEFIIQ